MSLRQFPALLLTSAVIFAGGCGGTTPAGNSSTGKAGADGAAGQGGVSGSADGGGAGTAGTGTAGMGAAGAGTSGIGAAGGGGSTDGGSDVPPVTVPVFSASASMLSFGSNGFVPCSMTPMAAAAQKVTLSNLGSQPYTWTANVGKNPSPFTVSPSSGTVAAQGTTGDSVVVTVTPAAIPFPADTRDNAYGDVLTITTNIPGDGLHAFPLKQTAQGAVVSLMPASMLAFGNVPIGTTGTVDLQVANAGNASAAVTLTASKTSGPADAMYSFAGSPSKSIPGLAGGTTKPATVGLAPGSAPADADVSAGKIVATVDNATVLCAPLPSSVTMSGTGTTAMVVTAPQSVVTFTGGATVQGGASLPTPGTGFTYCGTTAAAQKITFSNPGTNDYTITAATLGQGAGSPYMATIGGTGVVKANGGTNTVTIVSAAVPATYNFRTPAVNFTDTITITTDAQNDAPHMFNIVQSPYGAVLQSFFPIPHTGVSSFTFNNVAAGGQGHIPMAVTNNGNAPANVSITNINNGGSAAGTFTFDSATVAPFSSTEPPFNAMFNPAPGTANTPLSGTADFTVTATPLCAPLPVMSFTMMGTPTTAPAIKVTPSSIDFPMITCGATLPAAAPTAMVTITNTTGASISWTASIPANANATTFGLSAASGMVAAGQSGGFVVSPAPIPPAADVSTSGAYYNNTLMLLVAGTSYPIPVTESALGAMLQWESPTITSAHPKPPASSTSTPFKLQNFGNEAISVDLTLSNSTNAVLNLNNVPPPQTLTMNGTVPKVGSGGIANGLAGAIINTSTPIGTGSASLGVALSSTPGGVLCTPLPSALGITAK